MYPAIAVLTRELGQMGPLHCMERMTDPQVERLVAKVILVVVSRMTVCSSAKFPATLIK